MKNLIRSLLLIFIVLLGCSKEEESAPPPLPSFTVSIIAGDGGTVSTEGGTYIQGSTFNVTATPASGYRFVGWSNGESGSTVTITVNSNISITANFELDFSLITPQGFYLESDIYSINLNYSNIKEASYVNIYKGYCETDIKLFSTVPTSNTYTDHLVGFSKEVFYKISLVNSQGIESNYSEIKSSHGLEPMNSIKAQNITSRPIGVHYADYHFESERFTRIKQRFTIHELPTIANGNEYDGGLYWNFYNGVINDDIGFYFGIQTLVNGDPDGQPSKGVIFSRWKTRDTSNYRLVEGGWGQSAGYEGDFIGIRKEFEWTIGTYEIELKVVESDSVGDWYGLFIRNIESPDYSYIGSIRFEHGVNYGIKSGAGNWTEIYHANSSLEFPRWHISIDEVLINNSESPIRIQSRYFEEVWQSNQFDNYTNIFSPDGKQVHFLMGPYVKRFHSSGDIVTAESILKNLCDNEEDTTAVYNPSLNMN